MSKLTVGEIIKKSQIKSNAALILFSVLFLFVFSFDIAHGLVMRSMIDIDNYIVLKSFYELFPFVKPDTIEEYNTIASPLASDGIAILMAATFEISTMMIIFFITYFTLKLIMIKMIDKQSDNYYVINISLCVLLLASFSMFGIKTKTASGNEFETSIIHYLALKAIGDKLLQLERIGVNDVNKTYLIPQIKLGEKLSQTDIFLDFTEAYLTTDFEEENVKFKLYEKNNKYTIDVNLGTKNQKYEFASNLALVNNIIDIDYKKAEIAFIKSYFDALLSHASKVKEKTSHFNFRNSSGFFSIFDETDNYEGEYTKYCSTIYDPENVFIDKLTYNKFLRLSAMCASESFVKTHYENSFYSYDDVGRLKSGTNMIFGDSTQTEKLTVKQIIDNTHRICEGGFFACSEAVAYANNTKAISSYDLGILSTPVKEFHDILSVFEDQSDDLITSLSVDETSILNNSFKDNQTIDDGEEISVIEGLGVSGNYEEQLIPSVFTMLDPQEFEKPTMEAIINTALGSDVNEPLTRIETCLTNSGAIKNGIRCEEITKELRKLSLSLIRMSAELKLLTMISNVSSQPAVNATVIGNQIGSKALTAAKVGAIGSALVLGQHDFKSTPYHSTALVGGLLTANIIFSSLNAEVLNPVSSAASWMFFSGIGLLIFIYGILWSLLVITLKKLLEIIIEVVYSIIILMVAIQNGGAGEVWERFREFFLDLAILTIYCLIFTVYVHFRETIIGSQAMYLIENMKALSVDGGLSNLMANTMMFCFASFISLFMVFKAINVILGNVNNSIELSIKQ